MLNHLNNVLRHLFLSQIDELVDESQVRFETPDDNWRTYVTNLSVNGKQVNALNIYLIDVRENRKLHTNERIRSIENRIVTEVPASRRIDFHYLISAWSPSSPSQLIEPTIDEQNLLYNVIGVLMNNESLTPRKVYEPNPLPATFPQSIADAELPVAVLPAEGFSKLAEFWGTMGANHRWKPVVYLIVTLPVALQKEERGPMVTTRITKYRPGNFVETSETWIEIAGQVYGGIPTKPIAEAWVRLEDAESIPVKTSKTDENGCFAFAGMRQGNYSLRVRVQGFDETIRSIEVPSPTGDYNIYLT